MKNLFKLIFSIFFIVIISSCEKSQVETITQNQVVSEEILPETPVIEALWISETVYQNGNAHIICKVPGRNCKRGGGEVSRIIKSTNIIDENPELVVATVTYEDEEGITDTLFIEQ